LQLSSGKTDCFTLQRGNAQMRSAPAACESYKKENTTTMPKVVKVIERMWPLLKSWENAGQSAVTEANKTLRRLI
jgi:hypothetical protein